MPGGADVRFDRTTSLRQNAASWPDGTAAAATARKAHELLWYGAALVAIAGLGALKLALPLHRDTALFLWTAAQMDAGAVLYVDVWDVKQPGIFLFNYLAGKLFGFTSLGVHAFELIWHVAFAAVVIAALRPSLRRAWFAAIAPFACLAGYYVYCEPHQQTQLELLVGLPLFVAAWLTAIVWRSGSARAFGFFGAGVAAGIATLFKHVLAPIPVAFLVAASVDLVRRGERNPARSLILQLWVPFASGVLLVWGLTAAVFWRLGGLDAFLATMFVYPLQALDQVDTAPIGRFVVSWLIFAATLAPWLFYAAMALLRQGRAEEPPLFGRMALWLVVGVCVVAIQKSSWWTYHMLLLYAPVGVLAARGLDILIENLQRRHGGGFPAMSLSALLVLPVVAALAFPAGETARRLSDALSAGKGGIEAYQRAVSVDYAHAADAAAFLEEHAPPGPIYVFGDPTILLLTGRPQAIPLQGSAWGFFLPSQWRELPRDLRAARPVWIFLEASSRSLLEGRSQETLALLASNYHVVWDTPYGRWYALNEPGAPNVGRGVLN
jgi:hypothetical protein